MSEAQTPNTLLRGADVSRRVGRSMVTIWTWVRRGDFPAPLVLNPGQRREIVAWRDTDVDNWMNSRPQRAAMPVSRNAYEARQRKAAERRASAERAVLRRPQS
jgi:predicted DNA-binding transcriptional regulator AlpA